LAKHGRYLVHDDSVVRLQYALLESALVAVTKAAIVSDDTLFLSWLGVLAVRHIPFGARLIGAAPWHVVAVS
jgi:hypothetical protein